MSTVQNIVDDKGKLVETYVEGVRMEKAEKPAKIADNAPKKQHNHKSKSKKVEVVEQEIPVETPVVE